MNLNDIHKEYNDLTMTLRESYKTALFNSMKEHGVSVMSLLAYTPYFNDGDECKFSIYTRPPYESSFSVETLESFGIEVSDEYHDETCDILEHLMRATELIFQLAFGDHQEHLFLIHNDEFHHFHQEYSHD